MTEVHDTWPEDTRARKLVPLDKAVEQLKYDWMKDALHEVKERGFDRSTGIKSVTVRREGRIDVDRAVSPPSLGDSAASSSASGDDHPPHREKAGKHPSLPFSHVRAARKRSLFAVAGGAALVLAAVVVLGRARWTVPAGRPR